MFKKDKRKKSGVCSQCKQCRNKEEKERRHSSPDIREKLKASALIYRTENKERIRERYNKWVSENPKNALNARIKKYGISSEDYYEILNSQNGCCAICGEPPKDKRRFHVDHDHNTGIVRGLLCHGCNTGIGNMKENVSVLAKAIDYIKRHLTQRAADNCSVTCVECGKTEFDEDLYCLHCGRRNYR